MEDNRLKDLSKDIINQLAVMVKTSQIHDPSNVAVKSSIEKFVSLIDSAVAEGPIMVELVGEYFYSNGVRIKYSMDLIVNFDFLMREFRRHSMGSVTFTGPVTADDMVVFLKAFISTGFSEDPYTELKEALGEIANVEIGVLRKVRDEAGEVDIRKTVKSTYFNAVSMTRGVMNKIRGGERVDVKRAKRMMQSIVDMLLSEEEILLGMTAIKDYDDYTFHHSVNVSILSVSLGQKLGLSKNTLMELGLAALFHDVGKTEIPTEVLNKPSSFTDDEWKIMQRHPLWGVRAILKMKGFDALSIRAAIVAYEHHIHNDGAGYPEKTYPQGLDLFSRIVAIADQYDAITSARVYSRTPLPTDKALSLLMERSGPQIDARLLKFFINMVGVYPVGTAVMLSSREMGLVYGNNVAFPTRPKVMVITDTSGNKVQGKIVDLTEKDAAGAFKRSITSTLDPHKYKINLAEYLL